MAELVSMKSWFRYINGATAEEVEKLVIESCSRTSLSASL
jgi:hypothetical protein